MKCSVLFSSGLLAVFALASSASSQSDTQPTFVPAPRVPPAGTVPAVGQQPQAQPIPGEKLDASAFGPGIVESMEVVLEREAKTPPAAVENRKARNGAQGTWIVPTRRSTGTPHSGDHYASNKWGDTRMGIGFGRPVDVESAWFAELTDPSVTAPAVRIVGYRAGVQVAQTPWFDDLDADPSLFDIDLANVDRIEIVAKPALEGAGWYALDDLAYRPRPTSEEPAPEAVVIDFDDLSYGATLTGSDYRGLAWETGSGDFGQVTEVVHPPLVPPGETLDEGVDSGGDQQALAGPGVNPPALVSSFVGPRFGDTGANSIPPDTVGAVGIDHFVASVNSNLSIYVKATGVRVLNVSLQNFFGAGVGDPRVVFDPHSSRFIVLATNFSNRVYLAVSTTSNPTGTWFKTNIIVSQGADASSWPDYPTLGVDANGIYTSSYMVGGVNGMSLFAIDKAPLLAVTPALGTVTAWRQLPWEGAIQPCVTYGAPSGEYCVSRRSSTTIRVRRVNPPLNAPTLTEVGNATVPSHGSPPNAPALGSNTPIDAGDYRPMNAVFQAGRIWMAHGVSVSSRAAVRWYEINPSPLSLAQSGTISDPSLHYYYGTIGVNANRDVVIGFSGSNASQWVASYYAGRKSGDPAGLVSAPVLLFAGQSAYNNVDGNGNNRWGDYSLTSADPTTTNLWTIQEYARTGNSWGTRIAQLRFESYDVYCSGDGSLPNLCPCFGAGVSGHGCPNSVELDGAALVPSGTTNPDSLEFDVSGMPTTAFVIFLKGDANVPAGTAFGDGMRCVGGNLLRFGQQNAIGGTAQFPGLSGAPISSVSATTPGSGVSAYYQAYYRDPSAAFCPPGTFNITNGVAVVW